MGWLYYPKEQLEEILDTFHPESRAIRQTDVWQLSVVELREGLATCMAQLFLELNVMHTDRKRQEREQSPAACASLSLMQLDSSVKSSITDRAREREWEAWKKIYKTKQQTVTQSYGVMWLFFFYTITFRGYETLFWNMVNSHSELTSKVYSAKLKQVVYQQTTNQKLSQCSPH